MVIQSSALLGRTNSCHSLGRWNNDNCSEEELPLLLPETDEIKPSGTGESPLANIDSFVNVVDEKTGMKGRRETNTMPQWAGSCWYYLRYINL